MKKRCNRKIWAKINPVAHAIEGAAITPQHQLDRLRVRELAAIDAFTRGAASLTDWRDLTNMLNLCETMAREGIGPEALPACADAQSHLIESAQRFERTGRMGTTSPGIQALRTLYEYHDLQRQSISRAEFERMIRLTSARIKSRTRGVEVVE
jgi:hypothetical protein